MKVRRGAATAAALFGIVVLGAFARDAFDAQAAGRTDVVVRSVDGCIAAFAVMWSMGLAVAVARPRSRASLASAEIAGNGLVAALAAAAYAAATYLPAAVSLAEAVALVAIGGALGSPALATSVDEALVGRSRHVSQMARSAFIALLVAGILWANAWLTLHIGYFFGPLGFDAWPWTAMLASIALTAVIAVAAILVSQTYPRAFVAGDEASASAASSTQPVSQQRPG